MDYVLVSNPVYVDLRESPKVLSEKKPTCRLGNEQRGQQDENPSSKKRCCDWLESSFQISNSYLASRSINH